MAGYFRRIIRYLKYKMYYRPKMLYQRHLNTLYGIQNDNNYNNDEYDFPQETTNENRNSNNYASVPFMITRNMKLDLIDKGYTLKEIKNMTPAQAIEILKKKD